jgi:hypothetical protein
MLDSCLVSEETASAGPGTVQATFSLVVPGFVIEIEPPMVQTHLLVLLRAGMPRSVTVGEPGAQGAVMAGTQGVGTPAAAAVSTLHVPNGGMLEIGTKSMMFAAGLDSAVTVGGATIRVEGAVPDVHAIMALIATSCGISESPLLTGCLWYYRLRFRIQQCLPLLNQLLHR